jgi:hypothetical protein
MTKLQSQRTEELNELLDYTASITPRVSEAIEARIGWLKNNLGTKLSKEEKQMASEYNASKSSKTLSFNLN